jgi:arabinogalactan endo-1,4-beta-galactosidase
MKMKCITMALLAAIPLFAACQEKVPADSGKDEPETPQETQPAEVAVPSFAKGADISWVSEMEKDGKKFRKKDGSTADIMDVLKEVGINSIRLRVWVNPEGGWSGKDDVVKLAGRAAKAGLAVMVDFHYSDFFADPSRQRIPAAWDADKNDLAKMERHVSEHTTEVLQALKDAGVTPAWVQVGNETRNGMLWPAGQLWTDSGDISDGRKHFAALLNAGYDAVKKIFPKAQVLVHLNNAYEDNAWWFRQIKDAGGKYDAIALSHYPQAESKMTADKYNETALSRIKSLIDVFKVPVIISEVGVKTPAGETQAFQVLSHFMDEVKKIDRCTGVFYWEPEVYGNWKPAIYSNADAIYKFTGKRETWNAYNMGAFTSDGKASSVMNAFK